MGQHIRRAALAALISATTLLTSALGAWGAAGRHDATSPTQGGTVTVAYTTNLAFLDPAQAYTDDWWLLNGTIYNGLYQFDRHGKPQLCLAAAPPTISADGKTWTFKIRPDARFSNGMPVTADDFKFTMTRTLDPNLKPGVSWGQPIDAPIFQGAQDFVNGKARSVSGIQVVDQHTIRFVLAQPFSALPYILAVTVNMAMPRAVMQHKSADWINTHPLGAGPYMLQSWQRGVKAVLVRNAYYFRTSRPYIDKIVALENVPANLIALRIQKGEVDGFGNDQEVAAPDLRQMSADPRYAGYITTASPAAVTWLDLNVNVSPLDKPQIRQAIAMAINRRRLVQLLGGNAIAAYQMYIPLDSQHDPQVDEHPVYPYDPAKAAALVKAAGYNHAAITVLFGNDATYYAGMAPGIQQMLQQIGLNVNLRGVTTTSLIAMNGPLKGHQISFNLWSMDYPDAYDIYTGAMSCLANIAGTTIAAKYCDQAADTLFAQAQTKPLGTARDALLRQAQVRILQSASHIPLVFLKSIEIVSPRVQGFYYQPAFGWQFENYWLKH
jgi:ABC-type transport system substrate-binding protein